MARFATLALLSLLAAPALAAERSDRFEGTTRTIRDDSDPKPPAPRLRVRAYRGRDRAGAREYDTRVVAHLPPPDDTATRLDAYGGWARSDRRGATGFFRTEKIGDRWWLIDPVGNRFLHVAMNSVRPGRGSGARRAFRERFESTLTWRDATAQLLREHGFNGTGNWSDDRSFDGLHDRRPVHTATISFMAAYGKKRGGVVQLAGHKGYPNGCIFVFDPEFEVFADEQAKQAAERRSDARLLGYFSDNELPFPRNSLDRFLSLPGDDAGRRAAETWLRARRGCGERTDLTDAERHGWLGHVADRYFGIVARALRKHDPNHLYLGSRFYGGEKRVREVFEAAGRHVDVVSINVYGVWTPSRESLERWASWSGRPLLITEWYAKGNDSGLGNVSGAGWTVETQADRGHFYQNFALALLESQVCVGWHWHRYQDNDPTDSAADPSNRDSNKGIVDIRYRPYGPLLDAMRQLNDRAYPLTELFDQPANP